MIKAIVIEDQPAAQRLLKKYINEAEGLELKGIFSDAFSAQSCLNTCAVDLIFLDIHLPKLSGLDFLSALSPRPYVILATAFSDYAVQGYELDVIDYLLKPFTFERFYKAVLKVQRMISKAGAVSSDGRIQQPETIVVKEGYKYSRVNIGDIIYVKSDGDYSYVVVQEKRYVTLSSLKSWCDELPSHQFCQIHRSFLVNMKKVHEVAGNIVFIEDLQIPIGRVFKKNFVKRYLNTRIKIMTDI